MRVSADDPGICRAIAEGRVTFNDAPAKPKATPQAPVADDARKPKAKAKRSKHRNTKVVIDGLQFDSKKEGGRYAALRMMEKEGAITDLKTQVPFKLEVNGRLVCKYVADFTYRQDGVAVVEDVKSPWTRKLPVYRIKFKLMKACHNIDIHEV